MRKIFVLVVAWMAIWVITWLLPPITPGWLPFLPVLYPTYSIVIRRRNPGAQRTIAAMLTILLLFISCEWAWSHVPRSQGHLVSVLAPGDWRFEVWVYHGECIAQRRDLSAPAGSLPPEWRFPIWVAFTPIAIYPASVLWREARRRRDHVRDTCLISIAAGILFVAVYIELTNLLTATVRYRDALLYVLAAPPAFLFFGTIVGAFWSVPAIIMLRRRQFVRAAKTILFAMSVSAMIFSITSAVILWMDADAMLDFIDFHTLAALALGSVVFFITCKYLRRRLPILYPAGYCQRCGYNLTGNVSGVCPECGTAVKGP